MSIALFVVAGIIGGAPGVIVVMVLLIISFLVMTIISTAASNILNAALFYFASYHQMPAVFDAELLNAAFTYKKKRKGLFGIGKKADA